MKARAYWSSSKTFLLSHAAAMSSFVLLSPSTASIARFLHQRTHRAAGRTLGTAAPGSVATLPAQPGSYPTRSVRSCAVVDFGSSSTPQASNMPGLADAGHRPKVVIAGGGNAAHVAAGMFAKQGADVRMYVSLPEEAKEIRDGVAANGGITVHKPADTDAPEESYTAAISPDAISSNPADVIPDAELVIIITPAFAHEPILRQVLPLRLGPLQAMTKTCVFMTPTSAAPRRKAVAVGMQRQQ